MEDESRCWVLKIVCFITTGSERLLPHIHLVMPFPPLYLPCSTCCIEYGLAFSVQEQSNQEVLVLLCSLRRFSDVELPYPRCLPIGVLITETCMCMQVKYLMSCVHLWERNYASSARGWTRSEAGFTQFRTHKCTLLSIMPRTSPDEHGT